MWPLPPLPNKLLAITCTPQELTCSLIRPTRIANRYELYVHHCYSLKNHELEQLILCNPTLLRTYIQEVITRHRLEKSSCVIALTGPSIAQRIITIHDAHPNYHHLTDPRLKGLLWDFYYLYPEDDGRYAWYVAGIKQALLLQFKLLFSTLPLHLIGITTESMALLYTYKHLYGSAFRTTQLAHHMRHLTSACSLHGLLSNELIRRSLAITTPLPTLHTSNTARTALGLFLLGSNIYETH
jgi:hypothetical protein